MRSGQGRLAGRRTLPIPRQHEINDSCHGITVRAQGEMGGGGVGLGRIIPRDGFSAFRGLGCPEHVEYPLTIIWGQL